MTLPYPPYYLCNDPGSFAASTLQVRLPEIARRMLAENTFPSPVAERVEGLLVEMRGGVLGALDDPGAPDLADWQGYLQPYLGRPWAEFPFFVCESIFYRRLLAASGYFQPGPEHLLDPYAGQKQLGLETSREALRGLAGRLSGWLRLPAEGALAQALKANLWGNRADLSLWPAGAEGTRSNEELHQGDEFLLVNELPRLCAFLAGLHGGRVDLLIDNAGYEQIGDLALADLLLSSGLAREVRFHLKYHPTFVSDALEADVRRTALFIGSLADAASRDFSRRLLDSIAAERLSLRPHRFWNSPLPAWGMPAELRAELGEAALVISKGDAHFRRLLGDMRWKPEKPFKEITAYFPTRLAALRVDKSEPAVNLRPGQAEELDRRAPDWRTSGQWGMIQFA